MEWEKSEKIGFFKKLIDRQAKEISEQQERLNKVKNNVAHLEKLFNYETQIQSEKKKADEIYKKIGGLKK